MVQHGTAPNDGDISGVVCWTVQSYNLRCSFLVLTCANTLSVSFCCVLRLCLICRLVQGFSSVELPRCTTQLSNSAHGTENQGIKQTQNRPFQSRVQEMSRGASTESLLISDFLQYLEHAMRIILRKNLHIRHIDLM